jgi:two-component sensor histidine kinase
MYNLEGKPSGFVSVTRNLRETTADEKAQEASVAANLRDREALLQEVHHRVNNNLQVIASLLSWQVRQTHNGHTRTALKECQTRVLTIATIHEELYRSSNYSEIPSRIYVGKLAQNVFQAANSPRLRVELLLEVEEFDLPVDQAIPCGLILNELMTNAVKHAFPGNRRGTVVVRLKKTSSGFVELSVSDDGVGTPSGFKIAEMTTMGMQLVTSLTRQLKGTLHHAMEGGTNVRVSFPTGRLAPS